jgi:NAD(P)-dependent dehydrogenase (short-subunit alcohol dehydrogenase family)
VINLTLSQSAALAAKRIRVNAIAPGSIEFPGGIWDRRKREDPRLYQATVKAFLLTVSGLLRRWRTWFSFWRAMLQAG